MLRIVVLGFVVSGFLGQDKSSFTENDFTVASDVDPIIVGHSISDAHKQQWKLNNEKYKECGLCGEEMQAFPAD